MIDAHCRVTPKPAGLFSSIHEIVYFIEKHALLLINLRHGPHCDHKTVIAGNFSGAGTYGNYQLEQKEFIMRLLVLTAALMFPMAAFAAGSSDNSPPKPTETTKVCKDGKVWDKQTKSCVDAKESRLDDDTRYAAARELAYAGKYSDALNVLAAMSDQGESRVLTYYGFTHRKAGRADLGMQYYNAALEADPDNLLARSYMGQGLVAAGNIEAAKVQLAEIEARGGTSSWPETSLRKAIKTGRTYNY